MSLDSDPEERDVEHRIVGTFMWELQESDVDFDIVETIEGLIGQSDFGGEETLIEAIEEEVISDED